MAIAALLAALLALAGRATGLAFYAHPASMATIAEVDAAIARTQALIEKCKLTRTNMQGVLDNDEAIILPSGDFGTRVITRRHIRDLVLKIQIFALTAPEEVDRYLPDLARAASVPETILRLMIEGNATVTDINITIVMGRIRQHNAAQVEAGRQRLQDGIAACERTERMAAEYNALLEKRRKELEGAGPAGQARIAYAAGSVTLDGIPVDICMTADTSDASYPCEKVVADAFCRMKGHGESATHQMRYMAKTVRLGDRSTCSGGEFDCQGIDALECMAE